MLRDPHHTLCTYTPHPARLKLFNTHTAHLMLEEEPDQANHFLDVTGNPSAVYDSEDQFTSALLSLQLELTFLQSKDDLYLNNFDSYKGLLHTLGCDPQTVH